jgi:uncharacterized membrane protein YidH (DUF202 family)
MGMTDDERWLEEFTRERRHRIVLIVAAVIGILASVALGMASALNLISWSGTTGARNPAMLIFFVGPFMVSMGLGYAIYGLIRWRANSNASLRGLPRATVHRR